MCFLIKDVVATCFHFQPRRKVNQMNFKVTAWTSLWISATRLRRQDFWMTCFQRRRTRMLANRVQVQSLRQLPLWAWIKQCPAWNLLSPKDHLLWKFRQQLPQSMPCSYPVSLHLFILPLHKEDWWFLPMRWRSSCMVHSNRALLLQVALLLPKEYLVFFLYFSCTWFVTCDLFEMLNDLFSNSYTFDTQPWGEKPKHWGTWLGATSIWSRMVSKDGWITCVLETWWGS